MAWGIKRLRDLDVRVDGEKEVETLVKEGQGEVQRGRGVDDEWMKTNCGGHNYGL